MMGKQFDESQVRRDKTGRFADKGRLTPPLPPKPRSTQTAAPLPTFPVATPLPDDSEQPHWVRKHEQFSDTLITGDGFQLVGQNEWTANGERRLLNRNTGDIIQFGTSENRSGFNSRDGDEPQNFYVYASPDQSVIMRVNYGRKPVRVQSELEAQECSNLHSLLLKHNSQRDPRIDSPISNYVYEGNELGGRVYPQYGEAPKKPSILHPFRRRKWKKARRREELLAARGYEHSRDI